MTMKKKLVERRKHKRFQVPKRTLSAFGPHFAKIGRIVDISMGGVAFHHNGGKEPSSGSHKLDIILSERDFYLGDVSYRTISDLEIPDKAPSRSIAMRRGSLEFRKLTHNQKSRLEQFIQDHTIGEV